MTEQPWEQDPDSWKDDLEVPLVGKGKFQFLEMTVAIRPTVPVVLMPEVEDHLLVKDRDALKTIVNIADGQQALTGEDELFRYAADRNLWIRIPWEKC